MITLLIQDNFIRLTQLQGKQIVKAVSVPLSPGLVQNGVIVNKTDVSRYIRELLTAHGIADKQVTSGISGIHSIYRTVSLPRLNKKLLDEAAQRELERNMPVSLAELHTSWQAIDVGDRETVLCLVGLPKNTVDAMLDTLKMAELQCMGLDSIPLALARLADENDAIVIDIQSNSFDIVVMANGIPELLRSLTFPAVEMTAKEKVTFVQEELERTIKFYNSSHKEDPFSHQSAAFISGELHESLAELLEYRVKPLPDWVSADIAYDRNDYAANLGLALKTIKESKVPVRVNIDARPQVLLPKPRSRTATLSWVFAGAAVVLLVILALGARGKIVETAALESKVAVVETQLRGRQPANNMLKLFQSEVDAIAAAKKTYDNSLIVFKSQHIEVNGDLGKITSLTTGNMNVASISYGEANIFVHGNALDKATILDYSRELRNTGRFDNVLITDMHEIEYNRWAFILKLE